MNKAINVVTSKYGRACFLPDRVPYLTLFARCSLVHKVYP